MPEQASAKVVVVEDEAFTRRAIALALRDAGFEVSEAADAPACRAVLKQVRADVVVLDLGLPGADGLTFARELRAESDIGLVIVTRRNAHETRIEALDLGADDYLIKPVHYGELAARLRSVLRRRRALQGSVKRLGRWVVDIKARTVTSGAEVSGLTRGEFEILLRLIEAEGKIVSRDDLMHVASRRPFDADVRSIDALVSRLRRKLGDVAETAGLIVTAPGFGYRLQAPAVEA
jgi:DNA-binding response OmpR family regulator